MSLQLIKREESNQTVHEKSKRYKPKLRGDAYDVRSLLSKERNLRKVSLSQGYEGFLKVQEDCFD